MILPLLLLLVAGAVQAAPPQLPPRPEPAEPKATECPQAVPLRAGEPVPTELLAEDGTLACGAVAAPTTELAHLLELESWGDLVAERYQLDTAVLAQERDTALAELAVAQEPLPWLERPRTQRWLGRAEVAALVAAGVGGGLLLHELTAAP